MGLTDLLGEDRNYAAQIINEHHRLHWPNYTDIFCDIYQIPECQNHENTTYFPDGVHHTNALDILIANFVYKKSYRLLK